MRAYLFGGLVAVATMMTAETALAHHSFAAEFDANQPVSITGKLLKVDLVNPHSWVYVEVTGKDGKTEEWRCETPPPNSMIRRGITKASFKIGAEVKVDGYRAKDGTTTMNAQTITIDGRAMGVADPTAGGPSAAKGKSK